ncbi:MAG: hypothetical protein RKP20_17960 [Candidatus Competibacter sp.]|nr:hypothetical protein [Candidatus Competibacter sp.]
MTDRQNTQPLEQGDVPEIQERRAFLRGLGKWSRAVIAGVLLGGGLTVSHRASAGAWVNRRGGYGGGGGWINGGGGGGGWINRRGGYGGGAWVNR